MGRIDRCLPSRLPPWADFDSRGIVCGVRLDSSESPLTDSNNTSAPRRRPIWFKLALLAGSTLVALVFAEIGTRVWLSSKGTPYDGQALLEEFERNADTVKAFTPQGAERNSAIPADRVLHPYFGSESGPDPGGVRDHFESSPPEDTFEVLIVGGSVAMLFCRDAGKDLEAALARDPKLAGRKVKVLGGAHAAYKQPQQLNKVAYFFAHGYRPEVVINLDGFNEVANGFRNGKTGTHPLYPTAPVWAGLLWGRSDADADLMAGRMQLAQLGAQYKSMLANAKRWGLLHSAMTGTLVRSRMSSVQSRRAQLQLKLTEQLSPKSQGARRSESRELNGDLYDAKPKAVMDLAVKAWLECSISLNAMCKARGVHYLHALQPTLWDEGAKPMVGKENDLSGPKEWRRGVKLGYPRLRAAIPELEATGIPFVDLSMKFSDVNEPLYFDPCHFEPEGAKLLVEDVARGVLELIP